MTWSRRQRRVWFSTAATIVGCGALVWAGLAIERSRDTDFADPTVGITSAFKQSGTSAIRFTDVAKDVGIDMLHGSGARGRTLVEDTGSGLAWGDYDGDGDWDLYVVSFPGPLHGEADPAAHNRLYRNDGGTFVDVSREVGVADPDGYGMGASFADYDGDGDLDLYVTNYGPNRLFRNDGRGQFEEVAEACGVADPLWSAGVAWGDFDRDGHLDLYVCNYVAYDDMGWDPSADASSGADPYSLPFTLNPNSFDPQPNRLYRNRGDGTFADVAKATGVENPRGRSLAATFCDLDGDGWLDLYVNNDVSTNRLFKNLGESLEDDGLIDFVDIASLTGTADPRGSMGLSVAEIGDLDGGEADGLPDLFITHWVAQENALYASLLESGRDIEYRDRTRAMRLGEISIDTVGWGSGFADLDLDGRVDLAVANGSTLEERDRPGHLVEEPLFLFQSTGETFTDVAPGAGAACAERYVARGLAAADYDGDGDVDLAISVNRGKPLLLRNDTEVEHRALKVLLDGPASACFGAKVEVQCEGRRQMRWWGADVTFLGMHAPEMIFGLGGAPVVERVHVLWADGKSTVRENVSSGSIVVEHPEKES